MASLRLVSCHTRHRSDYGADVDTASGAGLGAVQERKADLGASAIQASWRPATADESARTVEVTWTTGSDVLRQDAWTGQPYIERLRVDDASVDLSRLRGGPVLDSHDRSTVRNQVGTIEAVWLSNGEGHARVRFASDADSDLIFRKVLDGIAQQVSVGYAIDKVKIHKRKNAPEIREAVRWQPMEISIVTIGADPRARVRSHEVQSPETMGRKNADNMEQETRTASEIATLNRTREQERVAYIAEHCTRHNLPELQRELIESNAPLSQCKDRVIDAIAAKPDNDVEIDSRIVPGDGRREQDFAKIAGEALLHRERIEDTKDPQALALVSRSMIEIARQCCELDGVGLSSTAGKQEIATRAVNSSATLVNVIAHTAGRALSLGYEAEPRVFAEIFRETSAQNFRPKEVVKLSDIPTLPIVAEGDDYLESEFTDAKETYSLASYGTIVALTRQLIVNDDIDAIARVPQMLGAAAAARENDVFWAILNTNGNMADTDPIFGAGTTNLDTGGLTAAKLETARQAMMSQTTENSVVMGLQPRWLVVGPDLLVAAEKLVMPPTDYSTSTLANTLSTALANQLQLRVEPRVPTGTYYVFSAFNRFDTCEFAYLSGQRGVYLERDVRFESGAVRLKATLDFGAAAIDRRGLYRVNAT